MPGPRIKSGVTGTSGVTGIGVTEIRHGITAKTDITERT